MKFLIILIITTLSGCASNQNINPENTTKKLPAETKISLYALGDIMMSRYIGKVMARDNDGLGEHYPFKEISKDLEKADIVLANLESVIGIKGKKEKTYYEKPYNFLAAINAADALQCASVDVVSLANNHAMDYGPKRIKKTREVLDGVGIKYFGAGSNETEAREPALKEINGTKFAFLGYGNGHSDAIYATDKKGGTAQTIGKNIKADIEKAKLSADIVIVSLHWGYEYETMPRNWQRVFAKKLIDYGADAIIGHHPHILQGIEIHKGKPIIYSLGNFLFDQKKGLTTGGMIAELKFKDKKYTGLDIIPLDRFNTYYPKIAEGDKIAKVKKYIYDLSLPINKDKTSLAFMLPSTNEELPVKLTEKEKSTKIK